MASAPASAYLATCLREVTGPFRGVRFPVVLSGGSMRSQLEWQESIRPGFQVFAKGGDEEFGAVRDVCPAGRPELLINVENQGDHCIPVEAILEVHDEKVVVDVARLPSSLRAAISHSHDAEVPGL